ncbi:MAG: universal stress protein [Anaerolineae bacterium]|nr:universal stress protein [Anaerolineae bacterium]
MFKHILLPLDGSDLAEKALPLAVALAHQFGSEIILIRMVEVFYPTLLAPHLTSATAVTISESYAQAHRAAEDYLLAQQAHLRQQGLNVDVTICEGPPADGILYTASEYDVDCIVMSTHGRGGLARWTLGSVADKVARHAPCPVLLVRQNAVIDQDNS